MQNNRKEITEAIQAADNALFHLRNAHTQLRSAGRWGIADIMGGGFLTTLIKHSKLDRAQNEMQAARDAVWRFSRELNDVSGIVGSGVDVGSFLSFADYFYDGFLADVMVQSRIKRARSQVETAISRITKLREDLAHALRR